ncbi:group III truncated hemoglobin [Fulvivirga sp. M361]|nr:group III truncated hemoglobin [Fulvivirga sp. M361]
MKTIESREDIELLVDEFYKRVIMDELIGYFFTQVVRLDWNTHIPVMYDFWETTLLGNIKYKGNPMLKHIELDKKEPLTTGHFDRWLSIWESTIKENFMGEKADEAIKRATQIGGVMKLKIQQHTSHGEHG